MRSAAPNTFGVSNQSAIARMINGFHPNDDVYQPGIMMMDVFHQFGFRVGRTGDENSAGISYRLGDTWKYVYRTFCRVNDGIKAGDHSACRITATAASWSPSF